MQCSIISRMVVINMKNPNALIAMAYVSENANNPYRVFCEYIKYCIFSAHSESMTIDKIKDKLNNEFGLCIPNNVLLRCLKILSTDKIISFDKYQVKKVGQFDIEAFDERRAEYKRIEATLLERLIRFVENYNRTWTLEFAREQLIKVLDKTGMAYNVFMKKDDPIDIDNSLLVDGEFSNDKEVIYQDELFVGKFLMDIISTDNEYKDYLLKVCEGLMICVGTYQLPSNNEGNLQAPRIKGTTFYFDTRLLLRLMGCAGDAAVEATKELVNMIKSGGGNIYYYPHTLEEMKIAFQNAINSLKFGHVPDDHEMRAYVSKIKNAKAVLPIKKSNIENDLAKMGIYQQQMGYYSEKDRLRYGFDYKDLVSFMQDNVKWEDKTIENDAMSIWETHMQRKGNYSEYCGTKNKLCVFVTSNAHLQSIALNYHKERTGEKAIASWNSNRLPVITDLRLTCRLWSPATQGERLSLLYLTSNVVAAQHPTKLYLEKVRELACELEREIQDYSGIALSEFFEDQVSDVLLEKTGGIDDNLNLSTLASSLSELTEWKAKEQEEITKRTAEELNWEKQKHDKQTMDIIEGAVDSYCKEFGMRNYILKGVKIWPVIASIILLILSGIVSVKLESWGWLVTGGIPAGIKILESIFESNYVEKKILGFIVPWVENSFVNKIEREMKKAELVYKEEIIEKTLLKIDVLQKSKELLSN